MNIKIKTKVKGNYLQIMERFDRALFEALKPKHADMEIVAFTGSKKGDRVHLRFHRPIPLEWISVITEDGADDKAAYFIDEGVKLPFPLTYWEHKHIVEKITEDSSLIIDDMTFKGSNAVISALMYPAIYAAFYPRKKIYQNYFGQASS